MVTNNAQAENVCCPLLRVADCADTKEHKHLVCGYSNAIMSNETIKSICIGYGYKECVAWQIAGGV